MYRNRLKNPRAFLRLAVDVNSNTVMITKANPVYAPFQEQKTLPLSEPWGKALVDGTLSDDLLGNVIHELTHHASLQTPVGNSLSTLALSHTSDVISTIKDADLMVGPARDTIRYEIANAYLQPLLEGLALFAEFDALPSDMPLSTWSNMVSLRLFCSQEIGKAFHAGNHPFSALKTKLEQRRRSFSWISRKTQLLKQVITDPYLLGYMVIKVLWIDLVQRNKVWLNTDLFVMFLNDYFFTDFSLGHLLVRPSSISIEDEVRFLDSYLHNRAVRLDQNINEYGLEFMLYHLKYTSVRPSYQNYSEELDKTLQIEWRKRSLRGLHYQTPDFVKSRTIPRVLAAPATVKIDLEGNFEA